MNRTDELLYRTRCLTRSYRICFLERRQLYDCRNSWFYVGRRRIIGLSSDNVQELKMVDSINHSTNEDLFWAMRWGGLKGSFFQIKNVSRIGIGILRKMQWLQSPILRAFLPHFAFLLLLVLRCYLTLNFSIWPNLWRHTNSLNWFYGTEKDQSNSR